MRVEACGDEDQFGDKRVEQRVDELLEGLCVDRVACALGEGHVDGVSVCFGAASFVDVSCAWVIRVLV